MSMIALNPARPGYSTVSPYLIVENLEQQLEFIKMVFGPEITEPVRINPDGRADLKIGNTSLVVRKTNEAWPGRTSTLYVYVKNINETYVKAMGANAVALFGPVERYNGDLECGFEDNSGNLWICAKFEKQLSQGEMMERLKNLGISSS
jgi:hypothetical protein